MKRFQLLVLVLAVLSAGGAHAAGKVQVYFIHTPDAEDPIGNSLAFQVKDIFRGSNTFELVSATPDTVAYMVAFMTISATEYATAYSYVVLYGRPGFFLYVDSALGKCGEKRLDAGARNIVSDIAATIEKQE